MKYKILTTIVALALVFAGGTVISQNIEMNPADGHTLFAEKGCNKCHSIWGVGGKLGPDLGKSSSSNDVFVLAGRFWNHSPEMMSRLERENRDWPTFNTDEMSRLLSYLYTLNLLDRPGDPQAGYRKLNEKLCLECHSLGGEGGDTAGSLDPFGVYTNLIPLAEGMWNAGKEMRRSQEAKGKIPHFEPRDMADIQAAIRFYSTIRKSVKYLLPPDIENGEKLFKTKHCNRCHGPRGGGGEYGPSLLERKKVTGLSQMAGALWNHSYAMTENMRKMGIEVPRLKEQQMADILAYLYFEGFMSSKGSDPEKGKMLYSKRGCSNCHYTEPGAESKGKAPSLAKFAGSNNPIPLITAMWNHAPAMRKWMEDRSILWPSFKENDLKHIWAYLKKISRSQNKPD